MAPDERPWWERIVQDHFWGSIPTSSSRPLPSPRAAPTVSEVFSTHPVHRPLVPTHPSRARAAWHPPFRRPSLSRAHVSAFPNGRSNSSGVPQWGGAHKPSIGSDCSTKQSRREPRPRAPCLPGRAQKGADRGGFRRLPRSVDAVVSRPALFSSLLFPSSPAASQAVCFLQLHGPLAASLRSPKPRGRPSASARRLPRRRRLWP